jgi:hypothetical protein
MAIRFACALFFSLALGFGQITPSEAFDKMRSLVGTWKQSDARTSAGAAFRISYRMISRDTAIVESFGDPAKGITETIYHRDGDHLMATHYCAQGNQPRLRMEESPAKNAVVFKFFDVTNLQNPRDSHLVRMRFDFIDGHHFKREEVYAENGREESSVLTLERVQ